MYRQIYKKAKKGLLFLRTSRSICISILLFAMSMTNALVRPGWGSKRGIEGASYYSRKRNEGRRGKERRKEKKRKGMPAYAEEREACAYTSMHRVVHVCIFSVVSPFPTQGQTNV